MKKIFYFLLIVSIVTISGCNDSSQITNFEECINAGNPATESYPRQCKDPISNRTFTEEIKDFWKLDNIELRQHETEGYYGCFGCSQPDEGPAICIDPIPEMKQVQETEKIYCNSEFEVVKEGTGNVGESCLQNTECELPMEFAVQSNCPFETACIDSKCKVVCPLTYHDPNPEVRKSYPFTCEVDSDCDCAQRESKTLECRCVDDKCVSVEAE